MSMLLQCVNSRPAPPRASLLNGETIDAFSHGEMQREFTYIDDIVEGIVRIMGYHPKHTKNGCDNSRSSV